MRTHLQESPCNGLKQNGIKLLTKTMSSSLIIFLLRLQKRAVANYLKHQGIKKIDLLIASHVDRDYIGGMKTILEDVEVEELWIMNLHLLKRFIESSDGFEREREHMMYNLVAAHESIVTAKGRNVRCFSTYEGHTTSIGRLFIEVLWPPLSLDGFLSEPGNLADLLRKGKAQTYKRYLQRQPEVGDIQTRGLPEEGGKKWRGVSLEELS